MHDKKQNHDAYKTCVIRAFKYSHHKDSVILELLTRGFYREKLKEWEIISNNSGSSLLREALAKVTIFPIYLSQNFVSKYDDILKKWFAQNTDIQHQNYQKGIAMGRLESFVQQEQEDIDFFCPEDVLNSGSVLEPTLVFTHVFTEWDENTTPIE